MDISKNPQSPSFSEYWQETRNERPWSNVVNSLDPEYTIKHPPHYISGRKYEPKDVIRDWGLNFNLGSAVKYISRAGRKGSAIEDLMKAQEFLQFEIDALKQEQEKTEDI